MAGATDLTVPLADLHPLARRSGRDPATASTTSRRRAPRRAGRRAADIAVFDLPMALTDDIWVDPTTPRTAW